MVRRSDRALIAQPNSDPIVTLWVPASLVPLEVYLIGTLARMGGKPFNHESSPQITTILQIRLRMHSHDLSGRHSDLDNCLHVSCLVLGVDLLRSQVSRCLPPSCRTLFPSFCILLLLFCLYYPALFSTFSCASPLTLLLYSSSHSPNSPPLLLQPA